MAVYFRCKNCQGEHPSPIAFRDRGSFESSTIEGNTFDCPITGRTAVYNKEDMFWREEH